MREREPIDLDAVRWAIRKGKAVLIPDIDVSVAEIDGVTLRFASDRQQDPIQRQNRKGHFYEAEELAMIRAHFPRGGTFVDVGANVGNHCLYVAGFCTPGRIIPFEPNPIAYKLLVANVMMNGFQNLFDLSHLGKGLSDRAETGFGMTERVENLGKAQMVAGQGVLEVTAGDAALANERPDFIKIDVEGMEMAVLRGLQSTIQEHSPVILVEVDNVNDGPFKDWLSANGYVVQQEHQRYRVNRNYLITQAADAAGAGG